MAKNYDPTLPIMKACGVPQMIQYLEGKSSYEEAVTKAQQSSRNYAKRQLTWFRNQLPSNKIDLANPSLDEVLKIVR